MLLGYIRLGTLFTLAGLPWLLSSAASSQVRSAVEVRFVKVDRTAHGVKVTFTITNSSAQPIFLPIIDVPGLREPFALQLLHFEAGRGWGSLGPFYDVPTGTALRVDPNSILTFEHLVADPCVVVWPGKRIPRHSLPLTPLSGTYKLRIGFDATESDWNKYRSFLDGKTSFKELPKLKTSESEVFTVSRAH